MHEIYTRQQKRAEAAHGQVSSQIGGPDNDKYSQLAKKFPALVHSCGLAQAVAFVDAKEGDTGSIFLQHLACVMKLQEGEDLKVISRTSPLIMYQRVTLEAIESATWLKRFSEALLE